MGSPLVPSSIPVVLLLGRKLEGRLAKFRGLEVLALL